MSITELTKNLTDDDFKNEVDLKEFLLREYAHHKSPPNIRTLRKRATRGDIPGAYKVGKSWVINLTVYYRFKKQKIESSMIIKATETQLGELSPADRVANILQINNIRATA